MEPTHYVDKDRLFQELKQYHKDKKAGKNPEISEYIGKCILLICNGLAQRPNFNGYTFKMDMISDGIEDCVAAVKNFNPKKSNNPFGYFTQISWWAFVQRILIEKKQQYLKHKNYQNNFMLADISNTENDQAERISWSNLSDQVIENFERSLEKNLTKAKKNDKINTIEPTIITKENINVRTKKIAYDTRSHQKPGSKSIKRVKRKKRVVRKGNSRRDLGSNRGIHPSGSGSTSQKIALQA